jgi:Penicillin binding protein transpeptidase domain/NTF2-like N-terminal transpeptidase domain/Penicillin-binding Protein dimerisation domain
MRERERGTSKANPLAVTAAVVGTLVALGVAAGFVFFLMFHTTGSPEQTADAYLTAWQARGFEEMDAVTVNAPEGGVADPLRAAAAQLGERRISLELGAVTQNGDTAVARYTATAVIATGHVWEYQGQLQLVTQDRHWFVSWSPSDIHPQLQAGERFALHAVWPARAQVLAADNTVLSSRRAIAQSGSLALVTGNVVRATAAQAKALGPPYQAGDLIGQGGVEEAYQQQLAGRPALTIRIEGPGNRVDATVARLPAKPGGPVRTSIDMHVQLAASAAVRGAATNRPTDVVAIQPSTGRVLAVIERPGGADRVFSGTFPPGSTFKVVTASALSGTGLRPTSTVQCPAQVNVGGRVFHNAGNENLGSTSLQRAFAVSCNSTFIRLATQRLSGSTLATAATTFGFNSRPNLGIPATLGRFTTPQTQVDLAADAFGQGTDLVSPLSEASMAGAVQDGTWRPPQLVLSPAPRQSAQPQQLSSTVLNTLRPMMRAVVTSGTAANVGFQAGVFGKTGTAEFGSAQNPRAHAWFIGYRGNVAFAVLVEGGGIGADQAGPIANAFLRGL